ncbi:MAG TPA: signal recognition particle-docking protein FtsY [Burkholderiales bacterium]|nr:signal recognition particle-docking protein FtsY [Burkholderiales bacterium]
MVFSFFKRKKKEDPAAELAAAVVQELVRTQEEEEKELHEHISSEISNPAEDVVIHSHVDTISETEPEVTEITHGFEATYMADINLETDTELIPEVKEEVSEVQHELQPLRKLSWRERLKRGLSKTRDALGKKLLGVFGGGKIDDELYDELESILLTSDVGVAGTMHLLDDVRSKVSLRGLKDSAELKTALSDSLIELVAPLEQPLQTENHQPFVIMMVGVNGAGKTTSIGKLAKYFQQQGKSVMLAAGDTFRAAAREQLIEWGSRNNVTVVTQQSGDSAAVCFDAIQSAIAKKIDIVLADTAGRLPTQLNLMEEIKKVKRVIDKALPSAPHEIMLVLDANIGQNALNQVRAFDDALGLTGLVLTKLDGTAKGGVICAIAKERPIPLRFIGVGESIDDLRPFTAKDYVNALLD